MLYSHLFSKDNACKELDTQSELKKNDNYDPNINFIDNKIQSKQSDGLYEKNLVIYKNILLFYFI